MQMPPLRPADEGEGGVRAGHVWGRISPPDLQRLSVEENFYSEVFMIESNT